jgi:hypothetical protein
MPVRLRVQGEKASKRWESSLAEIRAPPRRMVLSEIDPIIVLVRIHLVWFYVGQRRITPSYQSVEQELRHGKNALSMQFPLDFQLH